MPFEALCATTPSGFAEAPVHSRRRRAVCARGRSRVGARNGPTERDRLTEPKGGETLMGSDGVGCER
jgi:hypothetical protein